METINVPKTWSNVEASELLGCNDAKIRQVKSEHGDQLIEGTHFVKDGSHTRWTETGIKKIAERIGTTQAMNLRTKPAIAIQQTALATNQTAITPHHETAIDIHKTELNVHETEIETEQFEYDKFESLLAQGIAKKIVTNNFKQKTDAHIVKEINKQMAERQSDIDASVEDVFKLLNAIAI